MEDNFDSPRGKENLEHNELSLKVLNKAQELLKSDGHEEKIPELGTSRIVEYIFDPPGSIGGQATTFLEDKGKEEKSKIVINEQRPHTPFRYTKIMVSILQRGSGALTWELIFQGQRAPRFSFVDSSVRGRGTVSNRTISRKASQEDLEEFLLILQNPLYLIESPKARNLK